MITTDVTIVGGGFSGIYSAWKLAKSGARVTLFESADQLGGASLNSRPWNDHWLDNGAHNFDLRSTDGYEFYSDILGQDLQLINDHNWASTMGEKWTPGLENPDFSTDTPDRTRQSLRQMQICLEALESSEKTIDSFTSPLSKWVVDNFGQNLAAEIMPMIRKASGSEASQMSAEAVNTLGVFNRIKLGEDSEMIHWKAQHEFWNQRLAVSLHCDDARFLGYNNNPRFGYPAKHGLAGFGENALSRLKESGVQVCTAEAVTGLNQEQSRIAVKTDKQTLYTHKLLWTLPDHLLSQLINLDTDIQRHQIPVGFSLYAFEVHRDCVAGPDYLHDFSQNTLAYRYSHPTRYSNSYSTDNFGYVLVEIPVHPKNMSALQTEEALQRSWKDLLTSGYLHKNSSYRNSIYWPLMVGYSVPCPGFSKSHYDYRCALKATYPNLYTVEPGIRGRAAFITGYDKQLHQQLL